LSGASFCGTCFMQTRIFTQNSRLFFKQTGQYK
jgi:hypothetical protein